MAGKLTKFFQLSWSQKFILIDCALHLLLAKFYLHFRPFDKLTNRMGDIMEETAYTTKVDLEYIANIKFLLPRVARLIPIELACYPQALAAKWLLKRRDMPSTLYLGCRKTTSGEMKGHAWLRCANEIVTGEKDHEIFQVIAKYS